MQPSDPDLSHRASTFSRMCREEAILASLDPDNDHDAAPPAGVPMDEWREFLALCEDLDGA